MSKRKIIVYIATSADGYIARPDDGIDWLDRPRVKGDYGMPAFLKSIDTILWGRRTYEMALGLEGGTSFGKKIRSYVFSRKPPAKPPLPTFEWVIEPPGAFVKRLRKQPGKHVWVMGGAGVIGSLLDANEIDEFMIHVVPTFIGEGIPLIAPRHRTVPLELRSTKTFSDGLVRLHYRVR